uniref:Uncharacterized protein n=1 Tax=Sphaerodactylus townsendi TaxID=933632 RepID=A0ACB8FFG8_9SAUR
MEWQVEAVGDPLVGDPPGAEEPGLLAPVPTGNLCTHGHAMWQLLNKARPDILKVCSGILKDGEQRRAWTAKAMTMAAVERLLVARRAQGSPVPVPEWLEEGQLIWELQGMLWAKEEGREPWGFFAHRQDPETDDTLTAEEWERWLTALVSQLTLWCSMMKDEGSGPSAGTHRQSQPTDKHVAGPSAPCKSLGHEKRDSPGNEGRQRPAWGGKF